MKHRFTPLIVALTLIAAAPATRPTTAPADSYPALQKRLRELNEENAALRDRVARLSAEVTRLTAASHEADKASTSHEAEKLAGVSWTVDNTTASFGDTKLSIDKAGVGTVGITGITKKERASDPFLVVVVTLKNASQTKRVVYKTWRDSLAGAFERSFASAVDENGNACRRISLSLGDKISKACDDDESIDPGKEVTDVLIFERPIDASNVVTVTLPGKNLGSDQDVVLKLTRPR